MHRGAQIPEGAPKANLTMRLLKHLKGKPDGMQVSATNAEGPPVPIPNTAVKLCSGEDTWLEAAWENNSVLTQVGHTNAEGPPVPIPNTAVKLRSGDDTWLEAAWNNSSWPTSYR